MLRLATSETPLAGFECQARLQPLVGFRRNTTRNVVLFVPQLLNRSISRKTTAGHKMDPQAHKLVDARIIACSRTLSTRLTLYHWLGSTYTSNLRWKSLSGLGHLRWRCSGFRRDRRVRPELPPNSLVHSRLHLPAEGMKPSTMENEHRRNLPGTPRC